MWSDQFDAGEFTQDPAPKALLDSALPIVVKAINQRTGADSLLTQVTAKQELAST